MYDKKCRVDTPLSSTDAIRFRNGHQVVVPVGLQSTGLARIEHCSHSVQSGSQRYGT